MYNILFFYYGLFAILAQLLVFRQLSVLFYGNELFLGTFLSSWLFWVGLGSLFVRRLLKDEQRHKQYFSYGFLLLSVLLPVEILSVRLAAGLFAFGRLIGPLETVLWTFTVMGLICFVIGGQFSLACSVIFDKRNKDMALGRVYLAETLGAVAAGVLFTYLLIGVVPIFIISLILSSACILCALVLLRQGLLYGKNALLIAACLFVLFVGLKMEDSVNRFQWRGYELLSQKEARNSSLSLVRLGSIKNVFVDGAISASFPDPEAYEQIAHLALLAGADSGNVLVIGETGLGVLKEVLKHNPDSVDYVVFDNSFIELVRPYLDKQDILALADERVNIHYLDARLYVKKTQNKYDAIIMDIPEVPNLRLNRFYTQEFYNQLKSILKPQGIFALSIVSSENYLSKQTQMFNASVYRTLKSVFSGIEIIPGESIIFLCAPSPIDIRKDTILTRFNNRRLSNIYVVPTYFEYKLDAHRRAGIKELLEATQDVEINKDLRPVTYYYFAGFWQNKFTSPSGYLIGGVLLCVLGMIIYRKRKAFLVLKQRKECVLIFSLGFAGILLELILLLGFQIISGFVYWQMGLLFAGFMLGLFLGTSIGIQFRDRAKERYSFYLTGVTLAVIGMSMGLRCFLPGFINFSGTQNIIIFCAFLLLIGIMIGYAFVIAGFAIREDKIMVKAGSLYSADLWGAASGALLAANFIVPFSGILGALNFSAIVGFTGLAVFWVISIWT